MRHIFTLLIASYWIAAFASLAMVSTLNPEQGILAALTFLGAAPTPDAFLMGGGPLLTGFFSFAFAVACVLFLWTPATAFFGEGMIRGNAEPVTRLALRALAGIAAARGAHAALLSRISGRPSAGALGGSR
ncbi:hypothetical protein SAZ10_13585 [Mesorhizobium sp. BAC0120]|uniref:hypothetical protein n=1 Tax=Mesorhizobium sp. BAC0120 TaxID=3090670 RepID=UPI00298D11EA|nr:hypothetical protein [Mesorhizobium sp. BAC0120]MDW6022790.1 hypothetical protein [Mesorhizobium sp. BAC0120]